MTLADVVGETPLDEAMPLTPAQGMAAAKRRQRAADRLSDVRRQNNDRLQAAQRKMADTD